MGVFSFAFAQSQELSNDIDEQEPFNSNPTYNYAFAVQDEKENVFQTHSQALDDRVRKKFTFYGI